MKKRHVRWNIEYDEIDGLTLTGMDEDQARAIAEHINHLAKRLAETAYLLSMAEMNAVPFRTQKRLAQRRLQAGQGVK